MHLNHPQTIPPPQSMEEFSSTKLVPGVKKVEDRWFKPPYLWDFVLATQTNTVTLWTNLSLGYSHVKLKSDFT